MHRPIFGPRLGSQPLLWVGATVALIALWFVVYWQLPRIFRLGGGASAGRPGSHLE